MFNIGAQSAFRANTRIKLTSVFGQILHAQTFTNSGKIHPFPHFILPTSFGWRLDPLFGNVVAVTSVTFSPLTVKLEHCRCDTWLNVKLNQAWLSYLNLILAHGRIFSFILLFSCSFLPIFSIFCWTSNSACAVCNTAFHLGTRPDLLFLSASRACCLRFMVERRSRCGAMWESKLGLPSSG